MHVHADLHPHQGLGPELVDPKPRLSAEQAMGARPT
jgi:hypothetical protein